VEHKEGLLEIICSSEEEAKSVSLRLQGLSVPLQELYVHKTTLKEAFVKIIKEIS
jgi:hypothetical protein